MPNILIVDDLAADRAFLVTLLSREGHRLLEAANGREAVAIVRAENPDLVITDVLMPVMDGYELARQLSRDRSTSAIPVVFFTAHYGEREARSPGLPNGVSYVLTKPARTEEVLRIVGLALSGESDGRKPVDGSAPRSEVDREQLRLLTDTLSGKNEHLRSANARLRALINIGLELASERDPARLLQRLCVAARDLFGATYVTLGVIDPTDGSLRHALSCGVDASCDVCDTPWIKTGDSAPGILATVVSERRTLRGVNPGGDPAGLHLPSLHLEIQAYLAAPIASSTQGHGWICLVGNEGRAFTEDDEHHLTALAGQVGRIFELKHEILVRQQAESALRGEWERAQRYLNTAEVILLALDLEGRITLINRYACSVLGWTSDELLGRDWIGTCLPARMREPIRQQLRKLHAGEISVIANPVLTRSGEERLIEWRPTLLRDDAGNVVGTFSSGSDITERTQALESLRIAEERMRFTLQNTGVGIWDMDYTTGTLRWSETLEIQYGVKPGTFAGTFEAFVERVHADDREGVRETLERAVKSGDDFTLEHRSVWPDGTVRWLNGSGRIHLSDLGQPVRGVGISLDVTERRLLETQFQQAQKMEAIGRLAGGVAHDFNNLLTAILGYCELLRADLKPDDPRQADLAEIQKAGASAARLTRQLLAFSRQEIVEPTILDLNALVGGMQAMLGRLIGDDVKIVLALRPHLSSVKADRGQVEQIIMNLAVNGRDAMPKGGTLTLETANVELDEHYASSHLGVAPGQYVVLTVSDTGTGMTPQVQARLFEPFFTTKEPGKGTGLGLATVHGAVARSGGSVTAYSELGKGTSFKVYFPRSEGVEVVVEAPPPVAQLPAGTQTVLVVDDAEGLRDLTRRLLERHGYAVLVAENATEALELFEQHVSIDVLLTDVVMPGTSGPELTRRLMERRPALRVIYMSGYTEDAMVQHGVNAGIAFLQKPFTSDALGRKIREVLDNAAAASHPIPA